MKITTTTDTERESIRVEKYTLNERTAIQKKLKACKGQPLTIKMERGNNLRILCSKATLEATRKIIEEAVRENGSFSIIHCEDKRGKVVSDIIKVTDKGVRENRLIFTINIYRTTSSFLVNGTQVQKFIQKVIPIIQSWAQYNQATIEVMDEKIEQVLRETSAQYVEGAEKYYQVVAGKNRTEDTSEDSLKLDLKIQKIEKIEYIKLEIDDEIGTQENDRKLKEEGKNHNTNGR